MTRFIESLNISSSPYVNALLSVLAYVVVAKIADLFVDKVLRRFTRFSKTNLDDTLIDLGHRPIFLTIIIVGLVSSMLPLRPSQNFAFYFGGLMYSILAGIWCVTAIRMGNAIIEHAVSKVSDVTGMRKDIVPLVENVYKILILGAGVMVVLSVWRINITPVLASAGIAGAAVAFAAKDTIANFFGGVSVFMDRPFKIGDYIVLDQGERGEVVAIGVRSTRIKTRDDVLITIPNSIIANTKIINESAPIPNFRVRIPVSIAYGSDIDAAQGVLLEIAADNERILTDPAPRVRFREFGESSLNFELLGWVGEPALRGLIVHELNCEIYRRFSALNIRIPFPQRDVHIHEA